MILFDRYNIDFKSFLKRGVPTVRNPFSVVMITGYQGTGKSYYAIMLALSAKYKNFKIKTNIKSMGIEGREISYFTLLSEIYNDSEEYVLYIIDELSKKYHKHSPVDKPFYSFLQQSRKAKRVVIMINQSWTQTPTWLREVCKYVYTTNTIPFLPIHKTTIGDVKSMTFDTVIGDWVAPVVMTHYYKRNKCIASCYDTFEPIPML